MAELKAWKDLPKGGLITRAGSSEEFQTGDWRVERPIFHKDKCINCFICWVYCPDSAIIVEDGEVKGINLHYCKGCGICARECPPKASAIDMKPESEFRGEEG
jgi:pyruvate ferredoxin oxidoreductase delta subunit